MYSFEVRHGSSYSKDSDTKGVVALHYQQSDTTPTDIVRVFLTGQQHLKIPSIDCSVTSINSTSRRCNEIGHKETHTVFIILWYLYVYLLNTVSVLYLYRYHTQLGYKLKKFRTFSEITQLDKNKLNKWNIAKQYY